MEEVYSSEKRTEEKHAEKEEVKPAKNERVSVKQLKTIMKRTGSDGLFSAYATFPPHTYFDTQEEGEEVVMFLRQHPIVVIPWVLACLLALAIPAGFALFPPYTVMPAAFQFVVTLMWYLFVFGYALAKFMAWFFNIYIITDERIVDIDFINVLYRQVSTAKIEEIQDVNVVASGIFPTFFNFGNVRIQTAAEIPEFEFIHIPKPDKVGATLNQMIDLEEQEKLEGRIK